MEHKQDDVGSLFCEEFYRKISIYNTGEYRAHRFFSMTGALKNH